MNSCLLFRWSRIIFHHCSKRYDWSLEWFTIPNRLSWGAFPPARKVLDVSQMAIALHRIRPLPLIQSWLLQYWWCAFLYSSNGSFSDAIRLRSMRYGSTMFPWSSSHAFPNSIELFVQTAFGACDGSKNFNKFVPSLVRFLFYSDRIDSIEWQDPAPRQRAGDCLWIHIPRWGLCDPPLSSHQTVLLEVVLRQCVLCKDPLLFSFSSRLRNFGLSESECPYCGSVILLPHVQEMTSLFSENCVRVQAILPPDFLWTPSTSQQYLTTDRPNFSCHLFFGFGFLVCSCLQFLFEMGFVLIRHSAVGTSHWILRVENHRACVQKWDRGKDRRSGWSGWERTSAGGQCQVRERTRHDTWMTIVLVTQRCAILSFAALEPRVFAW